MAVCATCGNDYDKAFEITKAGETFTFDSFECAIQKLAPTCQHCECRIIGHGLEADGVFYCCDHCAERDGEQPGKEASMNRRDTLAALIGGALLSPTFVAAQGNGRTLVAYLSRSGNTRTIAGALSRRFEADLFEIRPREPWPADYDAMVDWAQRQREADTPPPLAEAIPDFAGYQTLFLGFPIWGTAMPPPVRSFLTSHETVGKVILPFITYGSTGPGRAPDSLAELAPQARILEPFAIRMDQERDTLDAMAGWLEALPVTP